MGINHRLSPGQWRCRSRRWEKLGLAFPGRDALLVVHEILHRGFAAQGQIHTEHRRIASLTTSRRSRAGFYWDFPSSRRETEAEHAHVRGRRAEPAIDTGCQPRAALEKHVLQAEASIRTIRASGSMSRIRSQAAHGSVRLSQFYALKTSVPRQQSCAVLQENRALLPENGHGLQENREGLSENCDGLQRN